MALFPTTEPEMLALAQQIRAGLVAGSAVFPNPPVPDANMAALIQAYVDSRDAAMAARAAAEQATDAKVADRQALIDGMKANLRYAENVTFSDNAALGLLGWGARRSRKPRPAAGQVLKLTLHARDTGMVMLQWQKPFTGGRVAAYRIQRRQFPGGAWIDVGVSLDTEQTLYDQPQGVKLEYRVIAINRSGEGAPSNTVAVVL